MGERRVSRRTVLRGVGLATGAAAVGAGLPLEAAGAAGDEGGVPGDLTVQQPGQPNPGLFLQALPAVNPAWNYRTITYHHFIPRPATNLNISVNGTVGMHIVAGSPSTSFFAPLDLPQGAVLREAAFECYNASAAAGVSVGITRTSLDSANTGGNFAFTQSGANKHTVVVLPTIIGPIDNTTLAYGLSSFLQGPATEFGFFGARVAWSNGLLLTSLSPQVRKLDTREPGPLTGQILTGQTRTLSLAPEVIAGAKTALVNLTITNTFASGFLSLFPAGVPWPGTSSINWSGSNQILANSSTVAVSPAGTINILCGGGGRTHVVIDLIGYYS